MKLFNVITWILVLAVWVGEFVKFCMGIEISTLIIGAAFVVVILNIIANVMEAVIKLLDSRKAEDVGEKRNCPTCKYWPGPHEKCYKCGEHYSNWNLNELVK